MVCRDRSEFERTAGSGSPGLGWMRGCAEAGQKGFVQSRFLSRAAAFFFFSFEGWVVVQKGHFFSHVEEILVK